MEGQFKDVFVLWCRAKRNVWYIQGFLYDIDCGMFWRYTNCVITYIYVWACLSCQTKSIFHYYIINVLYHFKSNSIIFSWNSFRYWIKRNSIQFIRIMYNRTLFKRFNQMVIDYIWQMLSSLTFSSIMKKTNVHFYLLRLVCASGISFHAYKFVVSKILCVYDQTSSEKYFQKKNIINRLYEIVVDVEVMQTIFFF